MLIIDDHTSHVCNEFISFTCKHKIVYLYLLLHLTYLLQPFDVDVFDLLKQNYKTLLAEKTQFTIYNFDKVDFIFVIQIAQQQHISTQNIQSE